MGEGLRRTSGCSMVESVARPARAAPSSHGSRKQRGGGRGACDRRARLGCAVVCTGLVRAGVRCRGVCGLISSPVHAQAG